MAESTSFYSLAKKLNHSTRYLAAGEEVLTTLTIQNIDELRALFMDNAPAKLRLARSQQLFSAHPGLKQIEEADSGPEILLRVEAYIFGDTTLSDTDRERIKDLFPMQVSALSTTNKTLKPDEVWDLGTSTNPVIINLGTLTMEAGSSIVIRNTVLKMSIETLVHNGTSPKNTDNFDLGILGVDGAQGATGDTGPKGGTGGVGKTANCSGPGGRGLTGSPGTTGGTGNTGGNGKPALQANVSITKGITGANPAFVIYTKSGAGGKGGTGGIGGKGGTGGKGGKGADCGCGGTDGGPGGSGGNGARGGEGGPGGNAINGNTIYVDVIAKDQDKIIKMPTVADPGTGGDGGGGGDRGTPGSGGAAGKSSSKGSTGGNGSVGATGPKGPNSTQKGEPGEILITPT